MTEINVDYFFKSIHKFPWTFMNLDVPKVGATHSYLCTILSKYDNQQQIYLFGRPTWGELNRYAEANGGLAKEIRDYCGFLYGLSGTERKSVAAEVLGFLRRYEYFREEFYNKLTSQYNLGRIIVPEEALRKKPIGED
jgi:hypothetical protein